MKSLTGKFSSTRGWAPLLILFLGAGLFVPACGDEEVPAPTTPAPPPAPAPAPEPEPEPAPEPPGVPAGLRVSASGADFIEWSWTFVEDVSGYDVQFSENEAFTTEDEVIARPAEETSYRRTDLEAGASGYLRVRSAAGTGETRVTSDWSTPVTGMAEPPPPDTLPAPSGLEVSRSTTTTITWQWNAVDGADGYESSFSTNSDFEDARGEFHPASDTDRRVTNLDPDSRGYLRVRAYTGTRAEANLGQWSAGVPGTTAAPPAAVPLSRPSVEVGDITEDSIEIFWEAINDAGSYQVDQEPGEANCSESNDDEVSGNGCTATGLTMGTEYTFRVRALPDDTEVHAPSLYSTSVSRTTEGQPPVSTDPVTSSDEDLDIRWTSESTKISWEWTPVADRRTQYQAYTYKLSDGGTNAPTTDESHPCVLDPTDNRWTQDGTTYTTTVATGFTGARFTLDSLQSGTAVLFCLQTFVSAEHETDEKRGQYGNLSWAWGIATPAAPSGTSEVKDNGSHVTTSLKWVGFDFDKPGFIYDLRMASSSGSERPGDDFDDIQDACEDGAKIETGRTSTSSTSYSVTKNLKPDTDYRLCYRARSSDRSGESEWSAGETLRTLPAKTNAPKWVEFDGTTGKWEATHKAGQIHDSSRESDYSAALIRQARSSPKPKVSACDDTSLTASIADVTEGDANKIFIEATVTDNEPNEFYFVCLRAVLPDEDDSTSGGRTSRVGPWIVSGGTGH